jgi:phosphoribosylaminoimidazole carboxylase (NCAIR synthetase)
VIHDIITDYEEKWLLEKIIEIGNTVLEQFSSSGIYSLEDALCKNANGSEEFKLIEFAYKIHNSGHGLIKNHQIHDNTLIRDQFRAEIAVRTGLEYIRLSNQSPTLVFNLIGSKYTELIYTQFETINNETLNEYNIKANVTVFWYFKDKAKNGRKWVI